MKPILDVKNLSVYYEEKIIDNVSFSLNASEIIGLIGHNGCGKSTMLKGIMGSLKQEGTITVNGINYLNLKIKQRAKYISMLTQRVLVIEGVRVDELICLGDYANLGFIQKYDQQKFAQIIKLLKIEKLIKKDYSLLSEGQKQLVQIARLLMQDTPVMFLDEPDSALDFANRQLFFEILKIIIRKKQKAGLVIIHNPLDALAYCDCILLMDEGKIIAKIDPKQDNCQEITSKMQLLYPNIVIKKDQESNQFYYLLK